MNIDTERKTHVASREEEGEGRTGTTPTAFLFVRAGPVLWPILQQVLTGLGEQ